MERAVIRGFSLIGMILSGLSVEALAHHKPFSEEDVAVYTDTNKPLRPGMAVITERMRDPQRGSGSCSLGHFVEDEKGNVYAIIAGHCYETTTGGNLGYRRSGYLHYTTKHGKPNDNPIEEPSDEVFVASYCPERRTLCASDWAIGKFVFAINNLYPYEDSKPDDPHFGEATPPFGVHNPDLAEYGDFALIRFYPSVAYSPQTCLFGGPTGLFTESAEPAVRAYSYGSGRLLSANALAGQIVGGHSALLFPNEKVVSETLGEDEYSIRVVSTNVDGGGSGGPVQTEDGQAIAMLGELQYLMKIAPNLERARKYMGLKNPFKLLAPGPGSLLPFPKQDVQDGKPVSDPACAPLGEELIHAPEGSPVPAAIVMEDALFLD